MNAQRMGLYGGVGGAVLGGFTWVIVAGVMLHDPALWISGGVIALATWGSAARAFDRFPEHWPMIFGIAVLFIVAVDWGYLAAVVPRLPERSVSPYFGTSRAAFQAVQPTLLVAGLVGTGLVLWDLLRRR